MALARSHADSRASLQPVTDSIQAIALALGVLTLLTYARTVPQGAVAIAVATGMLVPVIAAASILRRRPAFSGPADRITLFRTVLIGGVTAMAVLSLLTGHPLCRWAVVELSLAAIALDGVDGYVARKTRTATPEGARFDVEADAALILVLSITVAATVGWWALLIGLMRYAWVAVSWLRPALRHPLPFSHLRRGIGLMQGLVLSLVLIPGVPSGATTMITAISLLALAGSFSRDFWTLERATRNLRPV